MNEDRYLNNDFVPLCPICGRELTKTVPCQRRVSVQVRKIYTEGLEVSPRVQPAKGAVNGAVTAPAVSEKAALKGKMEGY